MRFIVEKKIERKILRNEDVVEYDRILCMNDTKAHRLPYKLTYERYNKIRHNLIS